MRYYLLILTLAILVASHATAQPPTPTPPGGQPIGTPTPTAAPVPTLRDALVVWERSDRAVVSWSSDAPMLCVGKYSAGAVWHFLACDRAEVIDTAPAVGDEYLILASGQTLIRLPLRSRSYLPALRR